jgi:uncharacterized Fe-S cluster protein YjdI
MAEKKDITKKYTNGEVTIVWKPSICAHSAICWKGPDGLKSVFDPSKKPWIDPEGAATDEIVKQIEKCPSGALSYYYNDEENQPEEVSGDTVVEVSPNGPLMIYGNLEIKLSDGSTEKRSKVSALCRCGLSGNKPFCDGSHKKEGWSE